MFRNPHFHKEKHLIGKPRESKPPNTLHRTGHFTQDNEAQSNHYVMSKALVIQSNAFETQQCIAADSVSATSLRLFAPSRRLKALCA